LSRIHESSATDALHAHTANGTALISVSSAEDIEAAREAVTLIVERGFNAGKDLNNEFKIFCNYSP
jgi:hypothetical protein